MADRDLGDSVRPSRRDGLQVLAGFLALVGPILPGLSIRTEAG